MAIVADLSGNGRGHNSNPATDVHIANRRATPVGRSYAVTPSDTVDLPRGATEYLILGTAGDVKVTYPNGVTDTITLPAGASKVSVTRVWATGTTATKISAGY